MPKDGFALFDFFANCKFFEEEFDYDRMFELPRASEGDRSSNGVDRPPPAAFTNTSPDPMAVVVHESIGEEGMRIDREMYRERLVAQVTEAAARHPELSAAVTAEDWPAAESLVARLLLGRPKEFWDLLKLQRVFQSDRTPTLREILRLVFGLTPVIATREQLAAEQFDRYLATATLDATKARDLRQVFHAYVLDPATRNLIDAGNFPAVRAQDAALYQSLKSAGAPAISALLDYIKAEVRLEPYSRVA